ncbi:hypothetical protein [Phenylobacterium sp.]|jgi:hypothetical protein|nr:hypothetical protein [Phenylobacterium sp.]HEX3363698.1 hypothetical protein [Phenylobacterium sp.]
MTRKPMSPDQTPVDEAFEDFKRTLRKIAERPHPLPANLKSALKAKIRG